MFAGVFPTKQKKIQEVKDGYEELRNRVTSITIPISKEEDKTR